jgi:GAF domain-containing protein
MPLELTTEITRIAHQIVRTGQTDTESLTKAAAHISRSFEVNPAEVAVFSLSKDGKHLRFVVPEKLQQVGSIPLTSMSSLAARTARERRPEIINHFSVVPHASVFEAVKLDDAPGDPIQKIMSVPLIFQKKVVGVIQVSRKARTSHAAGPDFTPQELKDLIAVSELLAPCVSLCSE